MGSVPHGTGFFYFNGDSNQARTGITLAESVPTLKTILMLHGRNGPIFELQRSLSKAGYEIVATLPLAGGLCKTGTHVSPNN